MTVSRSANIAGVSRGVAGLDVARLRLAIQAEYGTVAADPEHGFHFHTGRKLARIVGYEDDWLDAVPERTIASFAGTGNPFSLGTIAPGERVVDVGCGAGIDSFIAAAMTGPGGSVIGVDMTPGMVDKARSSAKSAGVTNVEFHHGFAESLPVGDGWADVVISNGVLNLFPDKLAGLREMARVLKPTGRLQIADIVVDRTVSDKAKQNIDLWKG